MKSLGFILVGAALLATGALHCESKASPAEPRCFILLSLQWTQPWSREPDSVRRQDASRRYLFWSTGRSLNRMLEEGEYRNDPRSFPFEGLSTEGNNAVLFRSRTDCIEARAAAEKLIADYATDLRTNTPQMADAPVITFIRAATDEQQARCGFPGLPSNCPPYYWLPPPN